MKIIYFDVAALALLIVIAVSQVSKGLVKGKKNLTFLFALLSVFVATVCGTIAIMFDNMGAGNEVWKHIFHGGYLLMHTLSSLFYLIWLISLTDTWHIVKRRIAAVVIVLSVAAGYIGILIYNIFSPVMFYINEAGEYTRCTDKLFYSGYIVGAFFILYSVFYIIRYRKLFTARWIFALFSPFPLIGVAMVIEGIYPNIVIELFMNTLGYTLLAAIIQKTDEDIDRSTGLYNENAFEDAMRKAFMNRKPFSEIVFKIRNYDDIRSSVSREDSREMLKRLGNGIKKINSTLGLRADMYYLHSGLFSVIIETQEKSKVNEAAQQIFTLMNTKMILPSGELAPESMVSVVNCPEDVASDKALVKYNSAFSKNVEFEGVLYASDVLSDREFELSLNLTTIIEEALSGDKFEVFYQPIWSVEKNKFTSAEALLRLKDDKYGYINPEKIVKFAEESGQIHRIGDAILRKVCQFIKSTTFEALGLEFIEINLSTYQCTADRFSSHVLVIIDSFGIDHSKINLEITETAITKAANLVKRNVMHLDNDGIRFSLDDFGKGYSNLHRIAEFPFRIIKLDRSLIYRNDEAKMSVIVESMIRMAKSLDLKIVAEGIENKQSLDKFIELGCDYIQGYYFTKPLNEKDFIAFIQDNNTVQ